jgi:hypothetical protein
MPSSIINSDDGVISGTSGLKSSGGDDGVLVFQSKGTETARINTDKQVVAAAGTASLPIYSTTGDLNTGIYFPAADNIGFATGGTIRGRWTTDGLCFGSDTAAANALDDYEQGTWTPSLTFDDAAAGQTGSFAGFYTKIGNQVFATCLITLTAKGSSTGTAEISGFPFATINNGNYRATSTSLFWENLNTSYVYAFCLVIGNVSKMTLYGTTSASSSSTTNPFSNSTITNNSLFRVSITYQTDL